VTVSDLYIAYAADTYLYEGIGYYGAEGSLGVLSEGTHNFYPYVDGKIIDEDPYNRGVQVPAVFGSSMYTSYHLDSFLWSLLTVSLKRLG
jgi:para-nitrobenzyl esterase